jgi:hypothetical protein
MALGVCDYCEVVAVHVTYSSIGMRGDCALRFGPTGAINRSKPVRQRALFIGGALLSFRGMYPCSWASGMIG